MSRFNFTALLLTVVLIGGAFFEEKTDYPISPVPLENVRLDDSFWASRLRINDTITIRHDFNQCELTGRTDSFRYAAGLKEGVQEGYCFNDTDIYKTIEAAAYALAREKNPELEEYCDATIALIARAQMPDGYLYTPKQAFNENHPPPGGRERWGDIRWSHELYCAGHMYEAAAAYYQATGKRAFLDIALKNADLVCVTFGPGKIEAPPGHEEVELGLVKLFRVTGERKYLDMAKYFIDIRGVSKNGRELGGEYNQDHKPVREQDEVVGHAVRASYLYAGMADVAALTGDAGLQTVLEKLWRSVAGGKLYITGGYGATGSGEAFGANYELPNMSAYCETCSSIAGMFWNYRMFLLSGESRYVDTFERTLYNAFLAGVSLDGTHFFYPNPLESVGQHQRTPWFGCACCPPNVARMLAALPGYFYAVRGERLYVNLYGSNVSQVEIDGRTLLVRQESDYPWSGAVKLTLEPAADDTLFELALRIPVWAGGRPLDSDLYRYASSDHGVIRLTVNGATAALSLENGYAIIKRAWKRGDVVELSLPMPVRRVLAHEKIAADAGRVALERGPVVYCVEWPDVEGGHVRNLLVSDTTALQWSFDPALLGGVGTIAGTATAHAFTPDGTQIVKQTSSFRAIPYYAWANRGAGEMQVWLAREESAVNPLNAPTLASVSRVSVSNGVHPEAVQDQLEPASSGDQEYPFFHWWPRKGTTEWIQYDFAGPQEVSTVEVYWFDDTGEGECRVPKSWRILYRDGEQWAPVYSTDTYGVEKDRYNRVVFETVMTSAVRLEITAQGGFAAGIHEWRIR